LLLIVSRFLLCKFWRFWNAISTRFGLMFLSSVERNLIWGNEHQQIIGDVIYWIFIVTWHFLKIVSLFVCFSACCFRFNGFSFIYLCCLLAIPLLPNPSRGLRVLELYYKLILAELTCILENRLDELSLRWVISLDLNSRDKLR